MLIDGHKLLIFWWQYCYLQIAVQSQEPSLPIFTIEANQSNVTVQLGLAVKLSCYFNTQVNCAWEREGQLLEISHRYSYQQNNGKQTTDCSILIRKFSKQDAQKWVCQTMATSTTSSRKATKVLLNVADESDHATSNTLQSINEARQTTQISTTTTKASTPDSSRTISVNHIIKEPPTSVPEITTAIPETGTLPDGNTTVTIAGIIGVVVTILIITIGIVCIYRYKVKKHRKAERAHENAPYTTRQNLPGMNQLTVLPTTHQMAILQRRAHFQNPPLEGTTINMENSNSSLRNQQRHSTMREDVDGYMKPLRPGVPSTDNDKAIDALLSHYHSISDDRPGHVYQEPEHFYHEIPE